VDISLPDALPGDDFVSPWEAALVGMKMDNPLTDPFPEYPDPVPEEYWDDSDGDGEPGLTLWPRGTTERTDSETDGTATYEYTPVDVDNDLAITHRAGCVSGGGRVVSRLEGTVESCRRLTGVVGWDESRPPQARVYSCTLAPDAPDWDTVDLTCENAWSTADRCDSAQVDLLDQQKQDSVSQATFELVWMGGLTESGMTCQKVREVLPEIQR
jgi:hypothetical protein